MNKLLFLCILFIFCILNASDEVKADPPLLSGALLMNRGLDFRQGGLVPEEKMRSPIFKYNFNKKQRYTPVGRKDLIFSVPDEISLTPLASHIEETNSSLFFSYEQTVKISISGFSFGIGIEVGKFGLGFNYAQEWGHIHNSLKTKFHASARGLYYTSSYNLICLPYLFMTTDDIFQMVLDRLPVTPKPADLELYKIFIDYYGGWFMWQGIFGGKLEFFSFVTKELVEKTDIKWVQRQLTLSFHYSLFNLSAGGFRNKTDIKIDNYFKENSEGRIFFTGGIRAYQNNQTLDKWDHSIDDYSGLLNAKFRVLSDLVKDEPVKKQNLEWIIKKYSETGQIVVPPASVLVRNLPKVPGYAIVGGGFDPTHMQTRRSIFIHDDLGFQNPTVWKNPFYDEHQFMVPTSVYLRENTGSIEINDTYLSMSKTEYETQYSWTKTKKYFFGFGKRTTSVFHYNYYFDVHQRYSLTSERLLTWYDLTLNPLLYFNEEMMYKYMDPVLKEIIDNWLVRDGYDTDPNVKQMYRLVIDTWGTDLVLSTTMGGGVTQSVFFKKDLVRSVTVNMIKTQSSFSFLGFLKWKSYNFKQDKHLADWFKEHVDIKVEYKGGRYKPRYTGTINNKNNMYYEINGSGSNDEEPWEEFVKSLRTDPDVVSYNTVPISYVIKDPKKKENMEKAIHEYLTEMGNTKIEPFYHMM